jgi:hemerythrin superfamily protein
MNAIELLKKDHQKVAGLFKKYEGVGDDASSVKEELFRMIKRELGVHARIEEEIFYPAARQVPAEEARELVVEAGVEHEQIKTLLAELEGMDAGDEQFEAKMTVLREDVEHHVEEEQDELFPKVKNALGHDRLEDLGRQLEARKQSLAAEQEEEEEEERAEVVGTGARASQGMRRATVPRSSAQSTGRGTASGSDDDGDDESESQETGSGFGSRKEAGTARRGGSSSDARDVMAAGSRSSMGGRSRSSSRGRSRSSSRGRSRSSSGRSPSSSSGRPGSRSRGRSGSSPRSRSGRSRSSRSRPRSGRR